MVCKGLQYSALKKIYIYQSNQLTPGHSLAGMTRLQDTSHHREIFTDMQQYHTPQASAQGLHIYKIVIWIGFHPLTTFKNFLNNRRISRRCAYLNLGKKTMPPFFLCPCHWNITGENFLLFPTLS